MSKKVIRIISFVLVVVTLLGFIIPYVSATELDNDGAMSTEGVVGETPESLYGTPPDGFELIVEQDYYRVQKNNADVNVWFQIPITNNTPRLQTVVFIVDIAQNMVVEQVELNVEQTYVNGLKLNDGYYALITGNYAFGDDGQKYEINDGTPLYFYIGDNNAFDYSLYDASFHIVDSRAIQLKLDTARQDAVLATLPISNSEVAIPEEITKMTSNDIVEVQPNPGTTTDKPIQPSEPSKKDEEEPKKEFPLITLFKNSWVWLLLLGVSWGAYKILENKKKNKMIKTAESDRNDKGRFE